MLATDSVSEHKSALETSMPRSGLNTEAASAIPSHVRHVSKGGSGDYMADPSHVLASDAAKAVALVRKLAADPTHEGTPKASKNAAIPLDFLKRCKGLQFVFTRMGGLLVSIEKGHSFVIQRVESQTGKTSWSGPCFGSVSNFGLGITAGFDALDTIVVLGNQMTVDKLKKGDAKFGVDIDLIVGKESTLAQTDNSWTETETAAIPYTLAGGALFDVSFKGGAHTVNHKKNRAVYGPDSTPEAILGGQLAPPDEFAPLYELLNKLSSAAVDELQQTFAEERES